jgi:hypothetical protein
MENRSRMLAQFEHAFDEVDEVRASQSLDLTDDEVSELAAGVAVLPEPIRAACQVVLDDWQRLDASERVAALLVFANALAEGSHAISRS